MSLKNRSVTLGAVISITVAVSMDMAALWQKVAPARDGQRYLNEAVGQGHTACGRFAIVLMTKTFREKRGKFRGQAS